MKKKAVPKKVQRDLSPEPAVVTIRIPTNGIIVKIQNGSGDARGTLHLTRRGFKFLGPNKKKWAAVDEVDWNSLEMLISFYTHLGKCNS